jgi:hypothetical protein
MSARRWWTDWRACVHRRFLEDHAVEAKSALEAKQWIQRTS